MQSPVAPQPNHGLGTKFAIYVTTATIRSELSSSENQDGWSRLRLLLGENDAITLEKVGDGIWEGKGNSELTSEDGYLLLLDISDPNKPPEEVAYVNAGAEFEAQYVGPEKHQYRFDSEVIKTNPGSTLDISCAVSVMLPRGAQYPTEGRSQAAAMENNPLVHSLYSMMGDEAAACFEETRNITEADTAISAYTGALQYTPVDYPDIQSRHRNLGIVLLRRFECAGNFDDLKMALSAFRAATEVTPNTGSSPIGLIDLMKTYYYLGGALKALCRYTGTAEPAFEAVQVFKKAVEISDVLSHPSLPQQYGGLGDACFVCFELTRNVQHLERAVEALESGIKVTAQDDEATLAALHNTIGNPYSMLFQETGDLTYLNKSIEAYKTSVDLTPPSDAFLAPRRYGNLCLGLTIRYKRTGERQDIEDAVLAGRKAVYLTPVGHPDLPQWFNLLASALKDRRKHTQDIKDIDEAISLHRKAVELTSLDHSYHSFRNQDLGVSLLARFDRTGDLRDIEEAIATLQAAIDTCPSGHVYLPNIYDNLGSALSTRFRRTGELQFADRAIAAHRQSVILSSPSNSRLPSFYSNLGASLCMRFGKKNQREDLVQAIVAFRKAVEISPADHDGLPIWYGNLAEALASQSHNGGGLEDIEEALIVHQKIVEITRTGGRNLYSQHYSHGILLKERFRHTNDERDLEAALEAYQLALHNIPEGHSEFSGLHLSIAYAKMDRHQLTRGHEHLMDAVAHFELAAKSPVGNPLTRFEAARRWAGSLTNLDDLSAGMAAFRVCIELLPLAAGLDQTVERRHTTPVDISDLSREAAAYAFLAGNPKAAVEWLEESRCLVWGQLNNLRTSLDDLRQHDQVLAGRFSTVSGALEKAGTRKGPYDVLNNDGNMKTTISLQKEAVAHVELAAEYETLLKRIRAEPGFQRFLKTPSFDELIENVPTSGYVVIMNVEGSRCDAVCLSRSREPLHVPLTGLSYDKALELRNQLRGAVNSCGLRMRGAKVEKQEDGRALAPLGSKKGTKSTTGRRGGVIPGILNDLWTLVAKPVVNALDLVPSNSNRKRVWWCLTGPLAFLPIHAAAATPSTPELKESLSNFVVSSYIPTVASLFNRSSALTSSTTGTLDNRFMLVSQPEAPGLCAIPGVAREVESVTGTLDDRSVPRVVLTQKSATVLTTLSQIKSHNYLHFACHAYQDSTNPLNSGFFLNDGKLTLSDIFKLGKTDAELAYLSACQTSAGDERLSEEAVHLAAGMLAAGFRGVVGTMWSIRDQDAPEMARDFYEYLLEHSASGIDTSLAAHALDHAAQRLKEKVGESDSDFLAWLPYVHFGV